MKINLKRGNNKFNNFKFKTCTYKQISQNNKKT